MIGRLARAASTAILVVLAAVLFSIAFAPHFGIRATVLTSGSMSPTVPTGGMIAVEEVDPADIGVGDVITYSGYTEDRLVTHRVLSIHDVDGDLHFRTQGDGNEFPDGDLAPAAGVVGRMRWDLTPVGPVLAWLTGSRAKMLIPGLAGLWLAFSEVREMRRSRRPAAVEDVGRSDAGEDRQDLPVGVAAARPTPLSPALPPPWLAWSSTAAPVSPPPRTPPAPPPPVPAAAGLPALPATPPDAPAAPAPPALSWSAPPTQPTQTRVGVLWSFRGGVRAATVGLATMLAVATLQMSAASFFDSAAVSAAAISTTAVDAPTGTSATFDCGQSTIGPHASVTWGEVGDAEGYEVRRRVGTSGDFTAVGTTTGATATAFTDTTVDVDTIYEYVVVASAWSWESEPSTPPAQVTTAASC